MTKSLLISIRPQHLLNILNGNKTYEVRKVVPKWVLDKLDCGETVEAYLYCTKGKPYLINKDMLSEYYELRNVYTQNFTYEILNGTIPVKVVIDGYKRIYHDDYIGRTKEVLKHACISVDEYNDYGNGKDLYALHISKVEILDEVMKLGEFYTSDYVYERSNYVPEIGNRIISENGKIFATYDIASLSWVVQPKPLQRPPQNMMTVWVK